MGEIKTSPGPPNPLRNVPALSSEVGGAPSLEITWRFPESGDFGGPPLPTLWGSRNSSTLMPRLIQHSLGLSQWRIGSIYMLSLLPL